MTTPTANAPEDLEQETLAPLSAASRWTLVAAPLVGFALILVAIGLFVSPAAAGFVASLAAGTFVGGGKLVILAGAVAQAPVGHWGLAALVVYIDLATALVMMGGIHLLDRLPGAGRRLAAARASGFRILNRNPWMHRAAWVALAIFIAVPFNGTGSLLGSVIGRLLGLSRTAIMSAIGFGSIVGAGALALASGIWAERINALAREPLLGFVVVAVAIALTFLGSRLAFGPPSGTLHE